MKLQYWYLVCHDCQRKQYIGAGLDKSESTVERLLLLLDYPKRGADARTSLRGLGASLLLAMKFIKLHSAHKLAVWMHHPDDAIAEFPDEWEYDRKENDFLTPHFDDIQPLGISKIEAELHKEIDRWKLAYEQVQEAYYNMQYLDDQKTEGERLRIAMEFRTFVENNGGTVMGPMSVDAEEHVGIIPPPDPRRQLIEDMAGSFVAEEDEE